MVQSVNRTLDILEALSQTEGGLGVTQLSIKVVLSKSTVHRLLSVLARRGYVIKDLGANKYCLGHKVFELGHNMDRYQRLAKIASPFIEQMVARYGGTVNLGILDENTVLFLTSQKGPFSTRMQSSTSHRGYINSTALGKALLAYLPKDEINLLLKRIKLKPITPKTITSITKLKEEVKKIRNQGYAVDDEEDAIGYRCVAVPLIIDRKAIAAVSVSGASSLITLDSISGMAVFMKKMTSEIVEELQQTKNNLNWDKKWF